MSNATTIASPCHAVRDRIQAAVLQQREDRGAKPVPQVEHDLERPGRVQRGEGSPERSRATASKRDAKAGGGGGSERRQAGDGVGVHGAAPGPQANRRRIGAASSSIAAHRLMSIAAIYLGWAVATWVMFRRCRPAVAVLGSFLGGWILLPVGSYPAGSADAVFPYWIIGLALPSDMLLTKAVAAPAAAFLGVLLFDRQALARLRPVWLDAPVALWCLWPAVAAAFAAEPRPTPLLAIGYLAAAWGLPWLLGRLYFASAEGRLPARQGPGVVGAGLPAVQRWSKARSGRVVYDCGVRDASVSRRRRRPLRRLQAARLLRERQPVRPVDLAQRVGGAVAGALVARRALALGGSDPGGDGDGRAIGRRDCAAGARRGRAVGLRPGPAAVAGVGRGGADRARRRRLPLGRDPLPGRSPRTPPGDARSSTAFAAPAAARSPGASPRTRSSWPMRSAGR